MLQTFIAVINYNFYLFLLRRNHFNFDHLKDDFHINFREKKKGAHYEPMRVYLRSGLTNVNGDDQVENDGGRPCQRRKSPVVYKATPR